jgi:hypothetical protein
MSSRKNRCPNCNAPRKEGTTFCGYCDLTPEGSARAESSGPAQGAGRRFTASFVIKLSLGLTSLMCCGPIGVYGTLYETVYSVNMEAPKYSAQPPPAEQRRPEAIEVMPLYLEVRNTSDRPLAQSKQTWKEKYEGRWVSWTGTVEEVRPYDSMASELVLVPVAGQELKVQANFDPLHNPQLEKLRPGQEVRVSGRLWGYYFMTDIVRLSEGALVEPEAPAQAQDSQ